MSTIRDALQLLLVLGAGALVIRFFSPVSTTSPDEPMSSTTTSKGLHARRRSSGVDGIPGAFSKPSSKAPEPLALSYRSKRQDSTSTSASKVSDALDDEKASQRDSLPVLVDSPTGDVELDVPLITVSLPASATPFSQEGQKHSETLSPTHAVRVVSFASPPHPARHDAESKDSAAHAALHARPGTPFVTAESIRSKMEEYEKEVERAEDEDDSDGEAKIEVKQVGKMP